jgi:hypothetical protein
VEHAADDPLGRLFDGYRAFALPFQQLAEGRVDAERERAGFTILRRARIEPYFARPKIDIAPFESEYFADSPARQIREFDHGPKIDRQVFEDGMGLLYLEKPHRVLQERGVQALVLVSLIAPHYAPPRSISRLTCP